MYARGMIRSFASILAFSTAALAVACSSGSSSGGSGAVSSVDSSKQVSGLSDTDAKQYCEDAQAYVSSQYKSIDTKRVSCGFYAQIYGGYGATSDADAQTKCRAQFDECMNKPDETGDAGTTDDSDDGSTDCASFAAKTKDCGATVGEVSQCLSDQLSALNALASKDFCGEAKARSENDTSTPELTTTPASCKGLETKCPSLYSDSETSNDSGG